jgi:hypothetical protein
LIQDLPFPSTVPLFIWLEVDVAVPIAPRSLIIFSGRILLRISSKRKSHILGRDVLENSRQPLIFE